MTIIVKPTGKKAKVFLNNPIYFNHSLVVSLSTTLKIMNMKLSLLNTEMTKYDALALLLFRYFLINLLAVNYHHHHIISYDVHTPTIQLKLNTGNVWIFKKKLWQIMTLNFALNLASWPIFSFGVIQASVVTIAMFQFFTISLVVFFSYKGYITLCCLNLWDFRLYFLKRVSSLKGYEVNGNCL